MTHLSKPANKSPKNRLKHRLLLPGVLLMPVSALHAQGPKIQCPSENTVERCYCAGVSWEDSTAQLQHKIPKALIQQWQTATIDPQLVVGCDDNLNRALLKQYQPLNNQGDPERLPCPLDGC